LERVRIVCQLPKNCQLWITVCVILILSACSGLSSEPEIDHIIPPIPTQTRETLETVADINQGAQIFAENCVRCHGIRGAGDGQLVQSGQISMTSDFTDPRTSQNNSLQNWFETITNGRIYALMPPWEDALTVEERWAVALYTYTLAYTDNSISNGLQNYITQCASCHGDAGTSTDSVPSLLGLLDYADTTLLEKLALHQTDLDLTPRLASDDLADITQYLRLLSTSTNTLPDSTVIEPIATPVSGTLGTINGHVRLGTDDSRLPDDLIVKLHTYDNQLNEQVTEYPVDSVGAYQFNEVVVRSDLAYFVSVTLEGWRFVSDIVVSNPKQPNQVIDVTLYESTDDSSFIEMTSRATHVNLTPQGLYVVETISLRNTADKMLIRNLINETVDAASVAIPIPPQAQLQLSASDASRFRVNQDRTLLLDTYPAIPDVPHIVQFAYIVPFTDRITFTQPVNYKVTGVVQLYIEDPLLVLQSKQVGIIGNRQENGFDYVVHQVIETPNLADSITYQIMTSASSTSQSQDVRSRNLLAMGLVLLGVSFTLIGSIALLSNTRSSSDLLASTQDIMQQIVELDKQFEAGKLESSTYQTQRDALKAKIADNYNPTSL
jgi:mono/diheme cytochrome c family protein